MKLIDLIRLSLLTFRSNRMRSGLTALGIIIGVMTVISILSFIQGLNATVDKQIASLGSNTITIQKFQWNTGPGQRMDIAEIERRPDLTPADAQALATLPGVDKVSVQREQRIGLVQYRGNKASQLELLGATPDVQFTGNYNVESGRFLNADDELHKRQVAVIGSYLVDNLFPYEDPLGKEIAVLGTRFLVVGVLEPKGSFLGQSQDNVIVVPFGVFQKIVPVQRGFAAVFQSLAIQVLPKSSGKVDRVIDQIRETLRRRRGLSYEKPDNFGINTQESLRTIYRNITSVAFIVMIAVAAISLLVGGIGIMNIMLVSVAERTHEIGLRKAVGATRQDILLQFLLEALVLAVVGGAIGIALGLALAKLVSVLFHFPSAAPLWTIFLGFGFSAAVGIFFGFYPANRAARLNPIEALRYE